MMAGPWTGAERSRSRNSNKNYRSRLTAEVMDSVAQTKMEAAIFMVSSCKYRVSEDE
jgi:hypothetical protein